MGVNECFDIVERTTKIASSIRKMQLDLLPKFGDDLQLRYTDRAILGYSYQHFWVTDGTWSIEFGGGELLENSVLVHCNPIQGLDNIAVSLIGWPEEIQKTGGHQIERRLPQPLSQ